jgi:hypothetical protein
MKRLNPFASLRLGVKYLNHSRQDAGGAKKSLTPSFNPKSEIRTSAIVWLCRSRRNQLQSGMKENQGAPEISASVNSISTV